MRMHACMHVRSRSRRAHAHNTQQKLNRRLETVLRAALHMPAMCNLCLCACSPAILIWKRRGTSLHRYSVSRRRSLANACPGSVDAHLAEGYPACVGSEVELAGMPLCSAHAACAVASWMGGDCTRRHRTSRSRPRLSSRPRRPFLYRSRMCASVRGTSHTGRQRPCHTSLATLRDHTERAQARSSRHPDWPPPRPSRAEKGSAAGPRLRRETVDGAHQAVSQHARELSDGRCRVG